MTAGPQVRRAAAAHQGFVTRVWRWIKIAIWQVFYGQSEWERICGPAIKDDEERAVRLRTSAALSSSLVQQCNVLFDFESFPVEPVAHDLSKQLKLNESDNLLMANLRACLRRFSFANKVFARVLALKDEVYSSSNTSHEEMLERLWSSLKPGIRRSGGRITKEWGEIGFQGTDPMSDFRGMGVLSLVQLNYFADKYQVEAQRALAESNHPVRWYPFAVTGINVTGFIIELVRERLLDVKLYKVPSGDSEQADGAPGVVALNEVYVDIFTRFNALWVKTNPRDVMAFPAIFQSLKDDIRSELVAQSFRY